MFRSPAKEMGEVQWLELSDVVQERHKPRAESVGKGGIHSKSRGKALHGDLLVRG